MKKQIISILFAIILMFTLKNVCYAASANISCESSANVGKEITITANVTGVQWNLELKVNGQTIAKSSELENYEANKTVNFSGKYTPNAEGTLNVTLEGSVTEYSDGSTIREFSPKVITVKASSTSTNETPSNSGTTQKSTEAKLSNLGINPKEYDFKGFKKNTYNYIHEVPNNVSEITVYAEPVKGATVTSGTGKVALKEGDNTIKVVVTAEAGNTQTYTLTIKRRTAAEDAEQSGETSDASLKSLGIKMLVRSMAPDVIVADEIGTKEDIEAIKYAVTSGVKGIFTAHANNMEDIKKSPILKELLYLNLIDKIIILDKNNRENIETSCSPY